MTPKLLAQIMLWIGLIAEFAGLGFCLYLIIKACIPTPSKRYDVYTQEDENESK